MATDAGKERTPEEGVEAAAVVLEEIHHARHPWPYQHARLKIGQNPVLIMYLKMLPSKLLE